MKTGRLEAEPHGSQVHDIAIADEAINIPVGRRARLMGATAIAGGALRGLAVAAGMATVFGAAPAAAQCFSGTVGTLLMGPCDISAATGGNATAVGSFARAIGHGPRKAGGSTCEPGQSTRTKIVRASTSLLSRINRSAFRQAVALA
jgi:hypothetical protein